MRRAFHLVTPLRKNDQPLTLFIRQIKALAHATLLKALLKYWHTFFALQTLVYNGRVDDQYNLNIVGVAGPWKDKLVLRRILLELFVRALCMSALSSGLRRHFKLWLLCWILCRFFLLSKFKNALFWVFPNFKLHC